MIPYVVDVDFNAAFLPGRLMPGIDAEHLQDGDMVIGRSWDAWAVVRVHRPVHVPGSPVEWIGLEIVGEFREDYCRAEIAALPAEVDRLRGEVDRLAQVRMGPTSWATPWFEDATAPDPPDPPRVSTYTTTPAELEARRAAILGRLGTTMAELVERHRLGALTADEWEAWDELAGISFLLGGDGDR